MNVSCILDINFSYKLLSIYYINVEKGVVMAAKKVFCAVCPKWEIKQPERCSNTLTYKKNKQYFCTKKCKERFEKAPENFYE